MVKRDITLHCKLKDTSALTFNICQESTVRQLKEALEEMTGAPADSLEIRFESQLVLDDMILVEMGVVTGDRLLVETNIDGYYGLEGSHQDTTEYVTLVRDNNDEAVRMLLKCGANPNACDAGGSSVLMHAASANSINCLRLLINSGADICFRGFLNETPSMWAASAGSLECLEALFNCSADVSVPNEDGDTPLMWAASNGHLNVVRFLSLHTDHKTKDHEGCTALDYAKEEDHHEIIQFLECL